MSLKHLMLGDLIAKGLALVGITEERVKIFIWDCKCRDRRDRLNRVDGILRDLVFGRIGIGEAKERLESVLTASETGGGK